ncbi:hypothetical protein SDC9_61372 [bioreactor metagenome]|uniref:Lipoprotein n=1 Tax=bioreactor metagenome TaxID=1076179 RepID=A0A644XGH6_9ZZZZ
MKKFFLFITLVSILLFSSCSNNNHPVESPIKDEETLKIEQEIFAVKNILKEFEDWEGDKTPNEAVYTLNLYNDKYILTIVPKGSKDSSLNWTDMFYFRDIKDDDVLTIEELAPMDKLASTISSYWSEDKQWIDKVINRELPYEEQNDYYLLTVDYSRNYNTNEINGLYFKISNTRKPITVEEGSITDKRQKLAAGIKEALNAPGHPEICTNVYFNNLGELIIEATSYWSELPESDREDIIYLLKGILLERKDEINVEGYGQFFSPVGRGLESFYAN